MPDRPNVRVKVIFVPLFRGIAIKKRRFLPQIHADEHGWEEIGINNWKF
jgi:hypothetical protein